MTAVRDPANAALCHARAREAAARGDLNAAFRDSLMALALDSETPAHRVQAFALLRVMSGYRTLPDLVWDALIRCCADPGLDMQPLALVVKETIGRAPLTAEALDHPVVLTMLRRAINIDPGIEQAFTRLRREALLSSPALLMARPALAAAMAAQAQRCAFPWMEERDETAALERADIDPGIRAMYRAPAAPFLDNLPRLTKIDDATSLLVQAQYRRHPYPPWDAPSGASTHLPIDPKRILIAGCGTGQAVVALARQFPNAEITAFDLSPESVSYAKTKAAQFVPGRVKFGVGDILRASDIGCDFDVVESTGVLHHMADPLAGLKALARVTRPGGLLKLALYSERGRGAVVAARALVKDEGFTDTPADMRRARQRLMALPDDHPAKPVVRTPDFFSLDALHDLVFNAVEHRTTPLGLRNMIRDASLMFEGFELADIRVAQAYRAAYPNDPNARDLAHWDAFEAARPDAFAEMYHFWCSKP